MRKPLFSGRQDFWITDLENIAANPYSTHTLAMGGHNLILILIHYFGIISAILYLILLMKLKPKFDGKENKMSYQKVAYIAFLSLFIAQGFESTLITGSYAVNIFGYSLLGISSSQENLT